MVNSFILGAVSVLAILKGVVSLPATEIRTIYPTVIPGPGLPSLESLNLTSEDLYTMPPKVSPLVTRAALYSNHCGGVSTANVNDAIACFNYLVSIGNNNCGLTNAAVSMCISGTANIIGYNEHPGTFVGNSCYNCALGVQWDFTNCNSNGQVNGMAASYGNGDLVMGVQHV